MPENALKWTLMQLKMQIFIPDCLRCCVEHVRVQKVAPIRGQNQNSCIVTSEI